MRIAGAIAVLCLVGIRTTGSSLADAQPGGGSNASRTAAAEVATNWQQVLTAARSAWRTNPESALALCNRAVALAPTHAEPLLLRAAIRDFHRDYAPAVRDVSEAIPLHPTPPDTSQLPGL